MRTQRTLRVDSNLRKSGFNVKLLPGGSTMKTRYQPCISCVYLCCGRSVHT